MPGTGETIGVRVPKVRELARELAKEDAEGFLNEMEAADGDSFYQEERMLQGMVIGFGGWTPGCPGSTAGRSATAATAP